MSAPPILPGQIHPPVPLRDTLQNSAPSSGLPVSAVARTMTASAVQQAQHLGDSEEIARLKRAIMEDSRTRLVGPSPAFQVSLLQHLRETQSDPPTEDSPEVDAPEGETQAAPETTDTPVEHAPYKTLQGMSETENPSDTNLTRSI